METKFKKNFQFSFLGTTILLVSTLFIGQMALPKSIGGVKASDTPYVLTLSETINHPTPTSGAGTLNVLTTSGNSISLAYSDFGANYPNCWGEFGMSGWLYNTTAISGISQIDIVLSSQANYYDYNLRFSATGYGYQDDTVQFNGSTATFSHSFEDTKPSFFRFAINDAMGVTLMTSMTITYSCVA